jgi:hypothetical protein
MVETSDPKAPTAKSVGTYLKMHDYKRVGSENAQWKGITINGVRRIYWCMDRNNEKLENLNNAGVKKYLSEHVHLDMKY